MHSQNVPSSSADTPLPLPEGILSRYPWITFVLPFAVFMVFTALEPGSDQASGAGANGRFSLGIRREHYPWIYSAKVMVTALAMLAVVRGYRSFPLRLSWLSVLVGTVGGVLWIGLSELRLEPQLLALLGLDRVVNLAARPAFNPLEELSSSPVAKWAFLAIRFYGLVLVVPIIEEFFLRGFLMRYVSDAHWWTLPLSRITPFGLLVGTIVPALYHPEILASLVWFSAVTWLMLRTRSLWDCVVAHGLTNLVLGVYVVCFSRWWLM